MARNSHSSSFDSSLIAIAVFGVTAWTHRTWLLYALYGLVVAVALLVVIKSFRLIQLNHSPVMPADVDMMGGLDFERYIATLLKLNGYTHVRLTEEYDLGVDIIAEKNGVRWGIQTKRYSGLVGAAAVRQVVTALKFYKCEKAMVITNSFFSRPAVALADSNDCLLIDKSKLSSFLSTF